MMKSTNKKPDRFMTDCGVRRFEGDGKPSIDQMLILSDNAESFLRSGGVVDWRFWRKLSRWSRVAFHSASTIIRRETCVLTGLASMSKESAAEVMSDIDGGDMKISVELDRIEAVIREKAKGGRPL